MRYLITQCYFYLQSWLPLPSKNTKSEIVMKESEETVRGGVGGERERCVCVCVCEEVKKLNISLGLNRVKGGEH